MSKETVVVAMCENRTKYSHTIEKDFALGSQCLSQPLKPLGQPFQPLGQILNQYKKTPLGQILNQYKKTPCTACWACCTGCRSSTPTTESPAPLGTVDCCVQPRGWGGHHQAFACMALQAHSRTLQLMFCVHGLDWLGYWSSNPTTPGQRRMTRLVDGLLICLPTDWTIPISATLAPLWSLMDAQRVAKNTPEGNIVRNQVWLYTFVLHFLEGLQDQRLLGCLLAGHNDGLVCSQWKSKSCGDS